MDIRDSASVRLESLQNAAIDAVEASIGQGDGRLALALLKATGSLTGRPVPIGPADPERIEQNRRARQRRSELFDSLDFDLLTLVVRGQLIDGLSLLPFPTIPFRWI